MRPAWRLAINSLSERRSRTALLVAAVGLSSALIMAVSCAMASVHKGIRERVDATVGLADIRVEDVGRKPFPISVLDRVRQWPEAEAVVGQFKAALPLRPPGGGEPVVAVAFGNDPATRGALRQPTVEQGRLVDTASEIVVDTVLHEALGAPALGTQLRVAALGVDIRFTLVGVVAKPPLGMMDRPEAFLTIDGLGEASGLADRLTTINVVLREDADAARLEQERKDEFADVQAGMIVRQSAKITSGLDKNIESSNLTLVIVSALTFLSAAFIIMTGLTTNITERQRELAILRCIGAWRTQLTESQIVVGGLVGLMGALIGVPFGIVGAAIMIALFKEQLPGGFAMAWNGVALAGGGAVVAGIIGAVVPAIAAARVSPLAALSVRARSTSTRAVVLAGVAGVLLAAVHLVIVASPLPLDALFLLDVLIGMPAMFVGYFLMCVPGTVLASRVAAPAIGRVMGLPPRVLPRSVAAAPFRRGFTSGAMMVGLAMLVAIWTNGSAVERDWLGTLEFPDAFVHGINLSTETQERIEQIEGVEATCAITLQPMNPENVFGIPGLTRYSTTYIAFEPEKFFDITELQFVEGDQDTARARLNEGGAILVAREFQVTKGLGVGDTLTLTHDDQPHEFEIVGVVKSPGLEVVSKFFDIGQEYLQQSISAVFGSRQDLVERLGVDAIHLIQIDIAPEADDEAIVDEVRRAVGFGLIAAGSGRGIKEEIRGFLGGAILVFSTVAVLAMLVACFSVANLVVAAIQARQFEFGVLRSVGATGGLLARLVVGETLALAFTACITGTIMGLHASWAGQTIHDRMIGLELDLKPPWLAILGGCVSVALISVLAAWPAVAALARRRPRELLGAVRG